MRRELIANILISFVTGLFFILMAFNSYLVFTKTAIFPSDYKETLYYQNDNTILNITLLVVFSIVILILARYLKRVINIKRLVLLVMIYVFIMSLLFAILRRDYVQFDPFNVIDQASNFIRGNYTGLDKGNNYLYIYSHQITTVFLFQIILSLFGRATFMLYLMQCFSISYIVFMLYKIANIFFEDEDVNYITVILSALCLPLIFYVAFVYGTLPGMFLVLLSFYHFIKYTKEKQWYNLVIVIFALNVAILFIGNNLISMLAIFAVGVLYLIKKFDKKIIIFVISSVLLMVAVKSLIFNYYEVVSGREMPQGVNKITWVAMGMQEGDREAGWWNRFNYDIVEETDFDDEQVKEISYNSIKQRVAVFKNNPRYAFDFYKRKYENQFFEPTFQSLLVTVPQKDSSDGKGLVALKDKLVQEIYFGTTNTIFFTLMKVYQIFIYFFVTIFGVAVFKKRNELYLIIPIAFIGGSIFHMIWEAKSRYIFPYFIFLIPLAAFGFVYFKNTIARYYLRRGVQNND